MGCCVDKWRNSSYLIQGLGKDAVSMQTSAVPLIDFKQKNFQKKSLESLVEGSKLCGYNCTRNVTRDFSYFRATPRNRSTLPDFWKQWPGIANDVHKPDFIPSEKVFSSVLRISSAGTVLFMHYDVMDNVLLQICGRKEVILFPPKEIDKLQQTYFGVPKKSNDLLCDPRCYDARRYPLAGEAKRWECHLNPGDLLFIPAFWLHSVKSLEFSVSVNIFWRRLPTDNYDKKDMFGNRDLVFARRADEGVSKAIRLLSRLPAYYRDFYARRFIRKLREVLIED